MTTALKEKYQITLPGNHVTLPIPTHVGTPRLNELAREIEEVTDKDSAVIAVTFPSTPPAPTLRRIAHSIMESDLCRHLIPTVYGREEDRETFGHLEIYALATNGGRRELSEKTFLDYADSFGERHVTCDENHGLQIAGRTLSDNQLRRNLWQYSSDAASQSAEIVSDEINVVSVVSCDGDVFFEAYAKVMSLDRDKSLAITSPVDNLDPRIRNLIMRAAPGLLGQILRNDRSWQIVSANDGLMVL